MMCACCDVIVCIRGYGYVSEGGEPDLGWGVCLYTVFSVNVLNYTKHLENDEPS